jgi:hypothetical protein
VGSSSPPSRSLRNGEPFLFHLSGRFLYVGDSADPLFGYGIGPEGRPELIDHAGGGMAITLPVSGT